MRKLLGALAVGAAVVAIYQRFLRKPVLNWGATAEEAARGLPGDELLEHADIVATRATTVNASPSAIWPWLVQMGPGRGGAYTYDWIENLFGLDMHSAEEILPELQHLEVGEILRSPNGDMGMRVEILEPERVLSFRSEDGTWVWTFVLEEQQGGTRLLSRNRIRVGGSLGGRLAMLAMEPGSLVMERKMLRGIKERAERLNAAERPQLLGDHRK
jgi:hypothetical protein